jgi:L-malate glycosyltransferase
MPTAPGDKSRETRIAVVAAGEIFGGAERQILTLISGLMTQLRAAPELVVFHDRDLAARARARGAVVHVLGGTGRVNRTAVADLRRIFAGRRFDLVSVHGYRASAYLALARLPAGTPVLKTEHGRIEAGRGGLAERLKARLYRAIENRAVRRLGARCVYVTRELQRQCAAEHRGLPGLVIYNGIDAPNKADTHRPPEYREPLNLVMVGRLEHVKAADLAIQALADPAMPAQAFLHLVGSGPELDALRALAQRLGVAARVGFHGFRANAFDYIAHADVLLLPSRHEGLPYTLLEAMALGTPVIAARVGGLEEVLTPRRDALVIEPGSPAALARAVAELASDAALRAALTAAGARLVAERYSATAMTRGYLLAAGLAAGSADGVPVGGPAASGPDAAAPSSSM